MHDKAATFIEQTVKMASQGNQGVLGFGLEDASKEVASALEMVGLPIKKDGAGGMEIAEAAMSEDGGFWAADVNSPFVDNLFSMIARAEAVISNLLKRKHPLAIACSFGKDSYTVLSLTLIAAAKLRKSRITVPPIVVFTADTGIENPEMVRYYRAEQSKVRSFAERHGLDVSIEVSTPSLFDTFAVRVIGGRALPAFPGCNADCSVDWKQKPQTKLRNQVFRRLQSGAAAVAHKEPIVLLGTRYRESEVRRRKMEKRGESDIRVSRGRDAKGKPTSLFLSPICLWSDDDVWSYLALGTNGHLDSCSDFVETTRIYRDAMGECPIVAEMAEGENKKVKGCGSRFGCSICTQVAIDHSMENMLKVGDRYRYMLGLSQLQKFIINTRWDLSRRNWIGRTITDGRLPISPGTYSPSMMEELLKYCLTLDRDEKIAAAKMGIAPRFELVSAEALATIDALWSLHAHHKPFHAIYLYKKIYEDGVSYPIPDVPEFARPESIPKAYLRVESWDGKTEPSYTGFRDAWAGFFGAGEGSGCMQEKILPDGRIVADMNHAPAFAVDMESFYLLMDLEWDHMKRIHDDPRSNPTAGYRFYARMGTIQASTGYLGKIDSMLRRAEFKVREGLQGPLDLNVLLRRASRVDQVSPAPSSEENGLDPQAVLSLEAEVA